MFTFSRHILKSTKYDITRNICSKFVKQKNPVEVNSCITKCINLGQPTFETHPHLIGEGEITPMISKFEYQCRRKKLVESIQTYTSQCPKLKKNHMIVIPAATKQYMSDKIPYVFRQNSDFLYLTGCQEPDRCVIIISDQNSDNFYTTLFTRNKDSHAELWDGPRTHPEDAVSFFGVDEGLPISDLTKFLKSHQKMYRDTNFWYDFNTPIQPTVHQIMTDFIRECMGNKWESPKSFVHKLRLYKSPAEIALMQKSCDITAQAFIKAMECSRPGIGENQLFATIDYEARMRGAEFLAYPPVVAGGDRATTIHYINNNQVICNNQMVLMDAGCEYHGYAADITRTWPINGKFTPEQKSLYEAVLCVQEELISLLCDMPTLDNLFESMCFLLGKKLQEIGILGIQPSDQYLMKAAYQLCPHHVSHYLGMDVHDTPSVTRNIKVEPGMVVTVEPGIYVSRNNKLLPKCFHGIGIRIEDDVLITVNGPVVLSRKCPKKVKDIEELVWDRKN